MKRKIIEPVAPSGMDIILTYRCPECYTQIAAAAPISPVKVRCQECGTEFPIIPADVTTLQYLKLMFANGAAIINPDFS